MASAAGVAGAPRADAGGAFGGKAPAPDDVGAGPVDPTARTHGATLMSVKLIRSALAVYGPQWWRVDVLQAREDVRAGRFNGEPGQRDAKNDRFVLLVALGFLAGALIGRYGGSLRPGELCLGQVAEFVDGGQKVLGNGRESEEYLQAAFGGLAGTCGAAPTPDEVWAVCGDSPSRRRVAPLA